MHKKLFLLALLLAAVMVTGCTGGSPSSLSGSGPGPGSGSGPAPGPGSGPLTVVTVSGTLEYEGDLDETVVTVGLNEYVTTANFEPVATAGNSTETQSSEPQWEAHYELKVPQGEYTFWLSGYGIAADTQELNVTANQTLNVGPISKIGLATTGTFYHVGQYAEIYLDIWDDSFDSATFNILDSSFSQSLPALRDYDTIEVPLNQLETGKNIFVEVQANGQIYYLPAFFITAPNAINFGRDETIHLPYTLQWTEVPYATHYRFGFALGTCNWSTNPAEFHNDREFHVSNNPIYYTVPGPGTPSCTISLWSYKYVDSGGSNVLVATARRDFPGLWFAPPLEP